MNALRATVVLGLGLGLATAAAGCSGSITDPDGLCVALGPPPAPVVTLDGAPGIVVPSQLALTVTPLEPSPDVSLVRLEVEIWRANPDGSARDRAWVGITADPALRSLRLADGTLEGAAALIGDLEPWQDHVVRARYIVSVGGGACESDGAWSDKRDFRTDDGSAAIFDSAVVRDYHVQLSPESFASIDAEALPPGCVPFERSYHAGTLRYDGVDFPDAGVKIKGGCGSARNLSEKAGLKIHLGWDSPAIAGCPDQRRILGLERFTFNNMVQDRTMSHELMAYTLYRAMGVPVPRATYARLHVNDELFGVYINVETIDRRFLARHFEHNGGQLYEGTYNCDLVSSSVRDDDTGCLRRTFEPDPCDGAPDPGDDPLDYTPVRALIAELDAAPVDGYYATLDANFDLDALMSMWAADAVLAHWDGYIYNIVNNYRLYHDPGTARWTFIPSGTDQTFQNIDDDPWAVSARIGQRCLQEPVCEAAFAARLREAVEIFGALDLTARRQGYQAVVEALVATEPGRAFDMNAFQSEHAETQAFIDQRAGQVMQRLIARGF